MGTMSQREEATDKRKSRLVVAAWSIGIILAIVIFLVLAKAVSKSNTTSDNTTQAPASTDLIAKLTNIPTSVFTTVGIGSSTPLPKPMSAPVLSQDAKPQIFYAGAEYCPYCAAERWPVVIALLRFGSFSNLGTTHSSGTDVYPSTQTLSFHGANYVSQYISFSGIEMQSNQLQGTSYSTLDTPTAAQQALITTYDAAPYVPASSAGAIPFIDFGGKFLISGATYSPAVLQGKSLDQIAAALSDPKTDIAKGTLGAANAITAAICTLTNNQPTSVCSGDMIQGLQAKLAAQ